MTNTRPRTLEDLRQAEEAAWLWDVARGRIVWANMPGVVFFGGQSVFDLVDRPFDPREPGILALQDAAAMLAPGQTAAAKLQFPGAGPGHDIIVQCSPHLLADGRQGVLAVAEPSRQPMPPVADHLAGSALHALPMAILVCDASGQVLHGNAAASAMFDLHSMRRLSDLVVPSQNAEALLARMVQSGMTSAIETMTCAIGLRDIRLTLSRLPSAGSHLISAVAEDVTDRRALERGLQDAPAATVKHAPQDAFAMLAKSLQDTIQSQTARSPKTVDGIDVEKPAPVAVAPPLPPDNIAVPAVSAPPFVPQPVRQSYERTGEAMLIGRGQAIHFATSKAAQLLGYESVAALMADNGLWQHIITALEPAQTISLPLPMGGELDLAVTADSVAWISGPAQRFVLRPRPPRTPEAKPTTNSHTAPSLPRPVVATAAFEATAEPPKVDPPKIVAAAPREPNPAHATQQAIAASELKAMLDVASDGIIALDGDGTILSFSAGAEAIFGMGEHEVMGKSFATLLSTDSRKAWRDYLAGLGGPGLASVFNDGREFKAVVKQGGEVPLFVTLGKLQSPHSKATYCAVVRDITQWKRTEQELRDAKEAAEQASRQKSDFLAGISHEIRTPLNAILGFSDVMRLERFGEIKNDKYRAYANDIHASGSHLLALVNDLLDLSKVEAGKMELDFTAVNASDAADHVLRLLSEVATRANVVVRKSFAAGLPRVVADLRALRQVLFNLVSNAIKYTDAGGQVIVSTQLDDTGDLVVRIKDSGIGMTHAQITEAMRPYARVTSSARERQGTGLGLPLSKALVEANRAQFAITSEPGKGTLTEIRFPATRVLAE